MKRPDAVGIDPSMVDQSILGNAALQAQVQSTQHGSDLEAAMSGTESVVGDGGFARSVVDLAQSAVAALQVQPRPPEEVERFVEIVVGSKLPADRKEALVEKLRRDQDVAIEAQRAVERHLGGLDAEARHAWIGVYDRVTAMAHNASSDGRSAAEIVGELASREGGAALVDRCAEVSARLCSELLTFLHFEDEEEELAPAGDYTAEASGS